MDLGILSLESAEKISTELGEVTELLNGNIKYGLRYISFEDEFPDDVCRELKEMNMIPIITWELLFADEEDLMNPNCSKEYTHLDEILDGRFDNYIENFALNAKESGDIIYLRPLHEFNANWYSWSGEKNGGACGGPEKVKMCWMYIVDKFRILGADNVKWIWCPHEGSSNVSLEDWNRLKNYWPGDEYVDLLGIDGFNFYPENPERDNPDFLSFESLFSEMYYEITALSDKPVFIMTGCSEFSYSGDISSKAEWIRDAFIRIGNSYPKIVIICWFQYLYSEKIDWRINSSDDSLIEFKKQFNG